MGELTLALKERLRISKIYVQWCKDKRIDVMPSTFLAWLEIQGYLNADKIREDLAKEKEELKEEDNENDI